MQHFAAIKLNIQIKRNKLQILIKIKSAIKNIKCLLLRLKGVYLISFH